ncbi:hypothetical protein [Methylobacterium nigriterrae]|uniref:hypothetical protein n=1 Tax=Methylobacterium nigriterrae TaxID=3127512 RepID=UPI0030141463
MNDPSPTPLYIGESPVAVPIPRAFVKAYLWVLAGFGGAATAALLVFAVATQSSSEAERIAGARSSGSSYIGTLVSAFAAQHGRKAY